MKRRTAIFVLGCTVAIASCAELLTAGIQVDWVRLGATETERNQDLISCGASVNLLGTPYMVATALSAVDNCMRQKGWRVVDP